MLPHEFEATFENEMPRLMRYARKAAARSRLDPRDIIGEGYIRGAKGSGGLKRKEYFASWMYRIFQNASVDLCREINRSAALPLEEAIVVADSDMAIRAVEDDHPIIRAVAELPARNSEVLFLIFGEELSYQEASEFLGIPVGTVKSRVHRGLTLMRMAHTDPRLSPAQ